MILLLAAVAGALAARNTPSAMHPPRMLAVSLHAPINADEAAAPVTTLDINTATAAQLQILPRIGPTLAGRIVADRERHGPYRSISQLDRVVGIGPRTIERLKPHIRIDRR